jgi:hypothetical protein
MYVKWLTCLYSSYKAEVADENLSSNGCIRIVVERSSGVVVVGLVLTLCWLADPLCSSPSIASVMVTST